MATRTPIPDPSPLLDPRSIAVVGASERIGSYADTVLRNLAFSGFGGPIWGVNPNRREVHGRPCFPSLLDLPEPADAVVVAIPAALVPAAIADAVERGCGGAVVLAAGFGEVESGRQAEEELRRIALAGGLPVCGPNGNGIVSVAGGGSIWGDSLPALVPGGVAMVSQSGNVAVNAIGSRRGINFHTIVSTGNQTVLDTGAWVEAIARREGVRSIALFQETDGDGRALAESLASCADRGVRVAVLKVGSSAAGGQAAAAHTGAVAGDHRVFRALMDEAGAAWATDPHELLELARVLAEPRALPKAPPGPRSPTRSGPAVLTCSGGDSGIAADRAEALGLDLPPLAPETLTRLGELLPEAATPGNPLDYTSLLWTETELLSEIVATVGRDPSIDQLLLFHDHPQGLRPEHEQEWSEVRRALVAGAIRSGTAAIFASTLPDLVSQEAVAELSGQGVPVVGGIPAALSAARAGRIAAPDPGRLHRIAESAGKSRAERTSRDPGPASPADRAGDPDRSWLAEAEAKLLIGEFGLVVPPGRTADDPLKCAAIAEEIGWPVAVKLSGPGIRHKSEIGAVRLDLGSRAEVEAACAGMLERYRSGREGGSGEPVEFLVEAMVEPGVELLVAARRDAVVPHVAVGIGGIWTELLDDVAVVPLPAEPDRIRAALGRLRGAAMLSGGRGTAPPDLDAVAELAATAGRVLLETDLELLELNPVAAGPDGAVVLDALARRLPD